MPCFTPLDAVNLFDTVPHHRTCNLWLVYGYIMFIENTQTKHKVHTGVMCPNSIVLQLCNNNIININLATQY